MGEIKGFYDLSEGYWEIDINEDSIIENIVLNSSGAESKVYFYCKNGYDKVMISREVFSRLKGLGVKEYE